MDALRDQLGRTCLPNHRASRGAKFKTWIRAISPRYGILSANYVHREVWKLLPNLLRVLLIEQPVPRGHSDGATIALLHASCHAVTSCIAMAIHVMVEPITTVSIIQPIGEFDWEAGGAFDQTACRCGGCVSTVERHVALRTLQPL